MAGQAELCPQCGAAIHFSESQTELICPYCGTTVVNPNLPQSARDETSDEQDNKETAQIIEALLALHKQLATRSVLAPAQIVSMRPRTRTVVISDPTSDKSNGRLMSFELEIRPEGRPPFAAKATADILVSALDKYHPGAIVYVRYDPDDPTQIQFDHRK